jgi:hypothetical protein
MDHRRGAALSVWIRGNMQSRHKPVPLPHVGQICAPDYVILPFPQRPPLRNPAAPRRVELPERDTQLALTTNRAELGGASNGEEILARLCPKLSQAGGAYPAGQAGISPYIQS